MYRYCEKVCSKVLRQLHYFQKINYQFLVSEVSDCFWYILLLRCIWKKLIELNKLCYYHIQTELENGTPHLVLHLSYTVSYDLKIYRSHSFMSFYSLSILYYISYCASYIGFMNQRFAFTITLNPTGFPAKFVYLLDPKLSPVLK